MKIEKTEFFNMVNVEGKTTLASVFLKDVEEVIASVDAESCRTKISEEASKEGSVLFSPKALNVLFKQGFSDRDWKRARLNYSFSSSKDDYEDVGESLKLVVGSAPKKAPKKNTKKIDDEPHISSAYDEVDFYKEFSSGSLSLKAAVEIQFGKYSFMTRDNLYKSRLFFENGISDIYISICPMQHMMKRMSSGIGFYEKSLMELCSVSVSHPIILVGISP